MIAEGFVANGARVLISSRDEAALSATAEELTAGAAISGSGGSCEAIQGSLGSRAGCEALAAAVSVAVPDGLHCLVNNSGENPLPAAIKSCHGRVLGSFDRLMFAFGQAPRGVSP